MKFSEEELNHLVFLSGVVLDAMKRDMMADTIQCLLYVVKSLPYAEFSEDVAVRLRELIIGIEDQLKEENHRIKEIQSNLNHPWIRKPFGK